MRYRLVRTLVIWNSSANLPSFPRDKRHDLDAVHWSITISNARSTYVTCNPVEACNRDSISTLAGQDGDDPLPVFSVYDIPSC